MSQPQILSDMGMKGRQHFWCAARLRFESSIWLDRKEINGPLSSAHSLLRAALVMLKSGAQSDEHFGTRFEKRLRFRLLNLIEILAEVID
jgi:hypothetical protein